MVKSVVFHPSLEDSEMESVDLTTMEEKSVGIFAVSSEDFHLNLDKKVKIVEDGQRFSASGAGDANCCCCTARHCLIFWTIMWVIGLVYNWFMLFGWKEITSFTTAAIVVIICIAVAVVAVIGAITRNRFLLTTVLIVESVLLILLLLICTLVIVMTYKYEDWKNDPAYVNYQDLLDHFATANSLGMSVVGASVTSAIIPLSLILIMTYRTKQSAT